MLRGLNKEQAQERVLVLLGDGNSVDVACRGASRNRKTYEAWRHDTPDFARRADNAKERGKRNRTGARGASVYDISFVDFRKKYLGRETYPHQQMWIDVIEGREPDLYHKSIQYEPKSKNLICINTPPFHAKSSTITVDYSVYRLCMNPAFRIMIISQTAEFASKFLFSIREILTNPHYIDLQAAYAPPGGFKPDKGKGRWGNFLIYLAGRSEHAVDKAAKDPSVQAVGIGGQVYGARADMIILDDCITETNAHQFEKQFDWLTRTVLSRAKNGLVLAVGTRVAVADLYSHILNPDTFVSGESPWTYVAQPAVLEFAEKSEDWVTLWPRSTQPLDEASDEQPDADGMYVAWDGPALSKVRSNNRPGLWALVYMQMQTGEGMTFEPVCVWGSVDKRRQPGPLKAGAFGHPPNGDEGMRRVLSIDPAGTGQAFLLHMCVDRVLRERWVSNAWVGDHTVPSWYLAQIKMIYEVYGIHELVIESNAYASWLIFDENIRAFCQQRGVIITGHYTGRNKQDPDFGVAAMASLFGTATRKTDGGEFVHAKDNVIHLPNPDRSPGVKALIEQLLTWVPGKLGKQLRMDGPMALWFAELRAQLYVLGGEHTPTSHVHNRWASPRRLRQRAVVPVGYY